MYFEPRETVMDREQAIQRLFDGINQNYKNWHGKGDNYHKTHLNMELSTGRKFDKVIENESGEPGRGRVWGFIAKGNGVHKGIPYKEGDVFKAAGWRAPAKHVRGSIYDKKQTWFHWTGPRYL